MAKQIKKKIELVTKSPVVTFLGHVDHGKTSILDAIRKTQVQPGEPGGITQHVRAHQIKVGEKKITFIDTPGHEAFTKMRSRGGSVADIGVLVVAADDSVKPQTKEAINLLKKSKAAIIVAINKVDLPGANADKVKQDLANNNVLVEGFGGDVPVIEVSAKTGKNIDQLLEMILLVADMLELKANPSADAEGIVLESQIDPRLGSISTVLVKNGSLKNGQIVSCMGNSGKIRALIDAEGNNVQSAGPADAASILGIKQILPVGALFHSAKSKRELEEKESIKEAREEKSEEEISILSLLQEEEEERKKKILTVVLKADASGTLEVIEQELKNLSDDEISVKIIDSGTGSITENDVLKAKNSKGIVIGFHVSTPDAILDLARREKVIIRNYEIIYELVDEIDEVLGGMEEKEEEEIIIGELEVRKPFVLSDGSIVAGCVVRDGTCSRGQKCYVLREGERAAEGRVNSLRVLKEQVKQVKTGQECGMVIDPQFEIEEGDKIICYRIEK